MAGDKVSGRSVMVLSAAAGAGYVRSAEALVTAFRMQGVPARHVEVLKHTNPLFRRVYSDLYVELVNRQPQLLGYLYHALDRPWQFEKRRLTLDRLNTRPLVKLLQQENPDPALCTHFLPAEILVHLRRKKVLEVLVGDVVTDFDAHAMWLYRDVDWYFVACEETKVHLAALGILPKTIRVTGIPIDPAFAKPKPKQEVRRELGLDPHRTTLLVSAGGFGMGPVESLVWALHDVRRPLQLCGCLREKRSPGAPSEGFPGCRASDEGPRVHHGNGKMDGCSRSVGGEGRGPDQFRGAGMRLGSGDREPDPGSRGAEQRSLPGGGCRYPLQ